MDAESGKIMKTPRAKMLVLYLLLVGLPVGVTVVVLYAGRGLVPPPSVGGHWRVEGNGGPADLSCAPVAEQKVDAVDILQSGTRVRMDLRPAAVGLRGKMDGRAVTARSSAVHLRADMEGEGDSETLAGTIEVPGCGAQVPFRATRDGPHRKEAR
jgi:hypothetical protein